MTESTWPLSYWGYRAGELVDALIAVKARRAGIPWLEARALMREWILEQIDVDIDEREEQRAAPEDDYQKIVCLLHSHGLVSMAKPN